MSFQSAHHLPFEVAGDWPFDPSWSHFKVGTCFGLWRAERDTYEILAITNEVPRNGHLTDVLEWFEHSCRRDKKALRVREFFMNPEFKEHLLNKRGFQPDGKDDVIKHFI